MNSKPQGPGTGRFGMGLAALVFMAGCALTEGDVEDSLLDVGSSTKSSSTGSEVEVSRGGGVVSNGSSATSTQTENSTAAGSNVTVTHSTSTETQPASESTSSASTDLAQAGSGIQITQGVLGPTGLTRTDELTRADEGVQSASGGGASGSVVVAASVGGGGGGGGSAATTNIATQGIRGVLQFPTGIRSSPKRTPITRAGRGEKVRLIKVSDIGEPITGTLVEVETDDNGEFQIVDESLVRLAANFMVVYGNTADQSLMRAMVTDIEIKVDPASEVTVRVALSSNLPLSSLSPERVEEMEDSVREAVESVEITDFSSIEAIVDTLDEVATLDVEVLIEAEEAKTEDLKGIVVSPQSASVIPGGTGDLATRTLTAVTEPEDAAVVWTILSGPGSVDSIGLFTADASAATGAVATVAGCLASDASICDVVSVEYVSATDVVFIIDTTGSMYGQIEGIKNSVVAFANDIEERGINVNLGAVTFGDFVGISDATDIRATRDGGVRPTFSLSSDFEAFRTFVGTLDASGGGDGPENALDGVKYAFDNFAFRPGARRIFILVIDITMHYKGDGVGWTNPDTGLFEEFAHYTAREVTDALCGQVTVHVISPGTGGENDSPALLAEGTGGQAIDMPWGGDVDLTTLPLESTILSNECLARL